MEPQTSGGSRIGRDAVITGALVLLAVAALDDITTDSARSFPLERTALVGCAAWFLVVAWRLFRLGHHALGVVSFGLVISAALVQPTIGPGTDPMQLGYLTTVGTLAWFLLVAVVAGIYDFRTRAIERR